MHPNGERIRQWATNSIDGDEYLIREWNAVVGEPDKVYFMGDVAIKRKGIPLVERLNGRKILIRGNHDIFKLKDYLPYFTDIRGSHKLKDFIISHIPIHPHSVPRWCTANIHSHCHGYDVKKRTWYGRKVKDNRYFNVSAESLNGIPIDFEDIKRYYGLQETKDG